MSLLYKTLKIITSEPYVNRCYSKSGFNFLQKMEDTFFFLSNMKVLNKEISRAITDIFKNRIYRIIPSKNPYGSIPIDP
mgnify:CR=1 FL=1